MRTGWARCVLHPNVRNHIPLTIAAVLLGLTGIAAAELVPEDPYADPPDAGVKVEAAVAPKTVVVATPKATPGITKPVVTESTAPLFGTLARDVDAHVGAIHDGAATFESGPLPSPLDRDPALAGVSAGYVCEVQGVLWSYVDIDNCRPAAIHGDSFDDSSPTLAAAIRAEYPEPEFGFWAEHGWKLMAPGAALLLVLAVVRRIRAAKRRRAAQVDRKTQFGMSAVDPTLAAQNRAAWEHEPAVAPTAVVSLIMRPSDRRLRLAGGTDSPPILAAGFDEVPLAAYPAPSPNVVPSAWMSPAPYVQPYAQAPAPYVEPTYGSQQPAYSPQAYVPPAQPSYSSALPPVPYPQPIPYAVAYPQASYVPAAPQAPTCIQPAAQVHSEPPAMPNAAYPLTFPAFPDVARVVALDEPRTPGVWEATGIRDDDGPTAHDPNYHQDYVIPFARGSEQQIDRTDAAAQLPRPRQQMVPGQPRKPLAHTIPSHGGRRS